MGRELRCRERLCDVEAILVDAGFWERWAAENGASQTRLEAVVEGWLLVNGLWGSHARSI